MKEPRTQRLQKRRGKDGSTSIVLILENNHVESPSRLHSIGEGINISPVIGGEAITTSRVNIEISDRWVDGQMDDHNKLDSGWMGKNTTEDIKITSISPNHKNAAYR